MEQQRRRLDPCRIGAGKLVRADEIEEVVGVGRDGAQRRQLIERVLDHEPVRQRLRRVAPGHRRRLAEGRCPFGLVGVQGDGLERRGHAGERRIVFRVIAGAPFRVETNRQRPDVEPGDQERVAAGGADHRQDAVDHPRVRHRPLVGLERAHRRPGDRPQPLDAEALDERLLQRDEILDRDHREAHAVAAAGLRIDRRRAGRDDVRIAGVEVDERVRRQDEELVGVDRLAGPDDRVPVARQRIVRGIAPGGMARRREIMRDQDGVRPVAVQPAVALPADPDVPQERPASGRVARQLEHLLLDEHRSQPLSGAAA